MAAAILLSAALAPATAAPVAAPRWRVGAARVDITPPPFDAAADAAAFPNCPAAVFSGKRDFALQEPYADADSDGRFAYPEPYCDANANARRDGMYLSGGPDHIARRVHDPIDARAIAFSDGSRAAVLASVVSQGLFETYTHRMRDRARQLRPGITDVIVSANHNESSPDPIGIYGALAPDPSPAGLRSGINDYYMAFLVERVAQAAAAAYDAMQPATISAISFGLSSNVHVRLSKNFPTTNDDGSAAATDPEARVLVARSLNGAPIVTIMNLSAHNQQIGHTDATSYDVSADWPGYSHSALERRVGGMSMFLVGVNGSEEDPEMVPPVRCSGACYAQAQATGDALAAEVADRLSALQPIAFGPLVVERDEFVVPLENNLFKAAAAGGLFGERAGYVGGVRAGPGQGTDFLTEVGVLELGPNLQMLANPGEAFPALMLGSPWGVEDASCPERPNPPVPAWHARARWRFQIGLADDMIGYLIPAWGFSSEPGTYTTTCFNDGDNRDQRGHQHKLEDEGVGPTGSNLVAEHLTAVLDRRPDPAAKVLTGRFLRNDGSASRRAGGALGIELAGGRILAVAGVVAFGERAVGEHALFMDYNGAAQSTPDLRTRGMLADDGTRWYLDVYPALDLPAVGAAQSTREPGRAVLPATGRGSGAAPAAGILVALAALASAVRRRVA